jgi:hypothetical protein
MQQEQTTERCSRAPNEEPQAMERSRGSSSDCSCGRTKRDQKNQRQQLGTEKSTTSKSKSLTPVPKHRSSRLNLTVGRQPEQGTGNRNQTERINVRSTKIPASKHKRSKMNEKTDPSGNEGLRPKRQDEIKRGKIEDSSGNKNSTHDQQNLIFP